MANLFSTLRLDPRHKIGSSWREQQEWTKQKSSEETKKTSDKLASAPLPPASADPRVNAYNALAREVKRVIPYAGQTVSPQLQASLEDSLLRAVATYWRAIGVSFTEVARTDKTAPRLDLSTEGTLALNQAAATLLQNQGTMVSFSPHEVVGTDAAASYDVYTNRLNIDFLQLLRPDKLSTAFKHEQVHSMSWTSAAAGKPWPSSGGFWAQGDALLPEIIKGSGVYRTYEAFDEMPAHLTSSLTDLVNAASGTPEDFRAQLTGLHQEVAFALDVTLRAEAILHRAQRALSNGPIQYVPQTTGGKGMALRIDQTQNPAHAFAIELPQPRVLNFGNEADQIARRTAVASTYVALARLAQSVMDQILTLPDGFEQRKVLVQALVPIYREVINDAASGEIHYTFEEAVERYNKELSQLLAANA